MKNILFLTFGVLWLFVGPSSGELAPLEKSYKILVLIPVSSWSHRQVILPIVEALADRGHQVVVLSKFPPSTLHPNIHELTVRNSIYEEKINFFEVRKHPLLFLATFRADLAATAKQLYNDTHVLDLYAMRKEFDLVMVDALFNEAMYPFAEDLPFITISTVGHDYQQSAVMGNVMNPAYVPTELWDFARPWKIHDKVFNILAHFFNALVWRYWVVPAIQEEVTLHLPDIRPLLYTERNASLTFLNSHYSIDLPLPLLPSQVQIGAIHCKSPKPLNKELTSWIEGAGDEGVIYVSLGSMAQGNTMPIQYRDLFVAAFARLSRRVIWKYEGSVPGVSENVLIRRWLPQQDILAHPKVKVFLSHGGLLSLQESIYHVTPIVALPIFGDQERVSAHLHNKGFGRWLQWEDLSVDLLLQAIYDVSNNTRYLNNVRVASRLMREQPTSPKELAVFWSEYIIKHKGAPHLRSPAMDLTWLEFFLVDALVFMVLVGGLTYALLQNILKRIKLDYGKMKAD
ncbi:UDP-glycosyltransferase UGT5-like [Palaemon carinicauda]|uniref:UDP-glycosyltransferase UGT5-like n=1 Tax=Palaemon carinicauda TaxID=392227 RepID=UPI0035B579A0